MENTNNTEDEIYTPENYDKPNIVGDIDTVDEEVEYLEKKIKIPVWVWLFLIIAVSIITLYLTMNQSPTIIF